jgi:F0F1-type ATP synthase assembly protein I
MPPLNPQNRPSRSARQFAWALELPFLIVGSVVGGGLIGYFLDRWLNTRPFLMLALGALGFFAEIRDLLRRLKKEDPDSGQDSNS